MLHLGAENQYLMLLQSILDHGERREDRTGAGTFSLFSPPSLRINLRKGFPLLTTKKMYWKGIVHELLWFLSGDTNVKYLIDNNVHIWDGDAYRWYKSKREDLDLISKEEYIQRIQEGPNFAKTAGDLGPIYGKQWRRWSTTYWAYDGFIDQIEKLIQGLKNDPFSRRHIVSAWNVGDLDKMALPPCHMMFQCYVSTDGGLSLKMYQRSADVFLGVPFNIASYALLTHMLAQVTGLYPKELIITFGDAHIYLNHIEAVKVQLGREPRPLPKLSLNPDIKNIDDFRFGDFALIGYEPYPPIKADLNVG